MYADFPSEQFSNLYPIVGDPSHMAFSTELHCYDKILHFDPEPTVTQEYRQ